MKFLQINPENITDIRGRVIYLHDDEDVGSGAFRVGSSAKLLIEFARYAAISSLRAEIFNESYEKIALTDVAALVSSDFITDKFLLSLDTEGLGKGLFFFRFIMETAAGAAYAYGERNSLYLSSEPCGKYLQLSVIDALKAKTPATGDGIIYHIFVDRFSGGGSVPKREDAILVEGWDEGELEYPEYPGAPLKNNTFFGGTLFGVGDKLDYIKSLGATAIYLSPVFEAASNHKYDTGDYMKVDEMFGGEEALKELIVKAKSKDIGIILDGVFNHTGADSVYFNRYGRYGDSGAYKSPDSVYYPWYDFKEYPDKYTCWWDIEILPRINPDKPECGDFIAGDGGVVEKYAKMGILGFRLDVADELSDNFIKRIRSKLAEINKRSVLYGEVWEDASNKIAYGVRKEYYLGGELDGVMNYPLRRGIIDFLKYKDSKNLSYALEEVTFNAPKQVQSLQMNLLGTHDTERIITVLGGESGEGIKNSVLATKKMTAEQRELGKRRLMSAYAILATLPGVPTVFYGDEIGLEGYSDPFNRRPYPWGKEDSELLNFYKRVGNIRIGSKAFSKGKFELLTLTDELLLFKRSIKNAVYITVTNNSDKPLMLVFDSRVRCELSGKTANTITVSAYQTEIIKTTVNNQFYIKNSGEPI